MSWTDNRQRLVIDVAGFQAGWLLAVVGAGRGYPLLGPAFTTLWAAYQLRRSASRQLLLEWLLICGLIGYLADSLLALAGWLEFPQRTLLPGTSPWWMVALWVNFGLALTGPLRWLCRHTGLGVLLGALAGPAAYWGGERLGAVALDGMGAVAAAVGPSTAARRPGGSAPPAARY